jgi:hypothetical protein
MSWMIPGRSPPIQASVAPIRRKPSGGWQAAYRAAARPGARPHRRCGSAEETRRDPVPPDLQVGADQRDDRFAGGPREEMV